MPFDLANVLESRAIYRGENPVKILAVGPLTWTKFRSYRRQCDGDYTDLLFVCTHQRYKEQVWCVAHRISEDARLDFLEDVLQRNPEAEDSVCYALHIELSPSPGSSNYARSRTLRSSRGGRRAGYGATRSHAAATGTLGAQSRRPGGGESSRLRGTTSLAVGMQGLSLSSTARSSPTPPYTAATSTRTRHVTFTRTQRITSTRP